MKARLALVGVGLAIVALGFLPASQAHADVTDFNFDGSALSPNGVSATLSTTQAGAHPDLTTTFVLNGDTANPDGSGQPAPWGSLRDIAEEIPPGLIGNPKAYPTCSAAVFVSSVDVNDPLGAQQCPAASQVGIVSPGIWNAGPAGAFLEPLYNLPSPGGDVVARFGFVALLYPTFIDVKLDPQRGNAVTATLVNAPSNEELTGATSTIWGVPSDPSHDAQRLTPIEAALCGSPCFSDNGTTRPSGLAPTAFLTNPTSCGPNQVGFTARNYPVPDRFVHADAPLPDITGCDSVPFDPTIDLQPTTRQADSPSGLDVDLHVPQDGLTDPNGLGSAHLKKAVVTMPEGMTLNPSAGDGLAGCTEAQIGLTDEGPPAKFNSADPTCPDGSKVGTAKITTPVLDQPIDGSLYLADPGDNPFHSLLSGYLVAKGQGLLLKVPGRFDLDPQTGRITATFDDNPQDPFSELQLHFKGGSRGVLRTPSQCGTYQIDSKLVPWSAADPNNPTPAETKDLTSSFDITSGPGGGPCPSPSDFNPGFEAGTVTPIAGEHSPLIVRASRPDGSQPLRGLNLDLPPGLTGKLAGIAICPEGALAAAAGRNGSAEAAAPSCPADSKLGSLDAGAGAGSTPFHVPGAIYLAGPYKGAPLSIAAITPAVAGPFDLGTVVVRAAANLDPATAQIHVQSDQLPAILQGIPLDLRSVAIDADRPEFTLNPTNCDPMSLDGTIFGSSAQAAVSNRFQVSACGALGFKPRLSLRLRGGTLRNGHPALTSVLTQGRGQANIARAQVTLPPSMQLDQSHITAPCTRPQFAANQCPAASVVGHATATTPLLDTPLRGPVYLRTGDNPLPDIVAALRGPTAQPIEVDAVGRIDTVNARLRTTFATVPDAPVSRFILRLQGGSKGLLVNNSGLCAHEDVATARFDGQNGKVSDSTPKVAVKCPKPRKHHHKRHKRHHRRHHARHAGR